uniref:magnesium chelatase n=1 Tax=Trentepohlia odorata TaxID=2576626 RepID=A0A4Y5P3H4_9CHLO|nr:magnesium chelatase subunit of protochlorophyllide reductase [Trentepohlia odorata]QCW57815.1 magnesium chelatase subunit of protochlorophyllide reductase [Trentepohlia odorata]
MKNFPFTAIVGQEELKLALILNIIDPKIGGLLILGDRGTGKSTIVRSLIDVLPEISTVKNDPLNRDASDPSLENFVVTSNRQNSKNHENYFSNNNNNSEKSNKNQFKDFKDLDVLNKKIPLVNLPLGATEDRVCGTLDMEKALREGKKQFEPGLLAKANRGILYVDEVNLLDDHLVDILLDSAASGWNTVEREGISISHPANFLLIGSGNPEEGELRPQLLDRFGMHAQISSVQDPDLRVLIVNERSFFENQPELFLEKYQPSQELLKLKILKAREILNNVEITYQHRVQIADICSTLNVDGIRGDIICNRAARALSALQGRLEANTNDILRIFPLCLRHRLRKDPLDTHEHSADLKISEVANKIFASEINVI